ncbi:hypothetical protein CC85DRAFT_301376 [Cutaneotrichosporon oleaginosum]|uniref:Uncharacterized protein n=1 Tax=Cutaneotrichosporon oleaginosum TaxID=879819 RepID=A0A0J0XQK7_9TREE|nr:uncharacterized protein CC85DRAFT_301376 [Cutaneotrichosporon oleaginosum]KLT43367.1 hypothetical protein CC85DRAFT_301376 [Cutaneotrichosporon oleaginosum]TXT05417.1 hypothetical protein COLE_06737 [Cutaneotrichosporon oleaginosum]
MDHRRHHSVDSPTSPLSRAGSGHVRSPLSQLRAQATQEAILNALDGPSEKPLPFPPFEPLLFKTPFRNRSTRATVPVHVTPGSLKSHAASFENESEGSSDETVCESYATARGSAAPLSRTWSSPDIEWPAVKESTSEARTPPSQTTAPSPAPSDAGPSRAIRPPRRPTIATPPVANVVAPTPVSLSPLTPTSRPAPLSIIGLPLTEEAPVLPRSEPSPLRRQHAISRRPSPTQMGHTNSQAHSVAHSAPCHTHSVSLSSIPTLSSLLRNAGLHVEAMSRPTVSNSPHSGSHQSLPPPPPRLPSTRRHSDTTLGRRSQAPSASAASPARLDSFPPLLTPVANTTRVAATYTHVLLRASAFAQHLTDRSVKSATVRAMLAFLHGQPDDPAQLASLLDRLGDALVEDRIAGDDTGLLERLLSHLSTYRGFDALLTTTFTNRYTCTSCGGDRHSVSTSWAAPHIGASVAGRWAPGVHAPLLLIHPDGYVPEIMFDRMARVQWALVGATVPVEAGLGVIAMQDGWTLFRGREQVPVDLAQPVRASFALYERV